MMHINFPFDFDSDGHTAAFATDAEHIKDMIMLFLFTNPGERVNRPDYGCGLKQLVFAGNSPELAGAVRFTIQAGLQRYLGDLAEVKTLDVTANDSTLQIFVQYVPRGILADNDQAQPEEARFSRPI